MCALRKRVECKLHPDVKITYFTVAPRTVHQILCIVGFSPVCFERELLKIAWLIKTRRITQSDL